MYTLVNKYGNREVKTESAIKRDHLLKEGFRLVEEQEKEEISQAPGGDTTAPEPKTAPVEGVADPSKAPAAKRKNTGNAKNSKTKKE